MFVLISFSLFFHLVRLIPDLALQTVYAAWFLIMIVLIGRRGEYSLRGALLEVVAWITYVFWAFLVRAIFFMFLVRAIFFIFDRLREQSFWP